MHMYYKYTQRATCCFTGVITSTKVPLIDKDCPIGTTFYAVFSNGIHETWRPGNYIPIESYGYNKCNDTCIAFQEDLDEQCDISSDNSTSPQTFFSTMCSLRDAPKRLDISVYLGESQYS